MTQRQPAAYQCRMKTTREGSEWRNWHEISQAEYEIYSASPGPNILGVIREVRPLFDMAEVDLAHEAQLADQELENVRKEAVILKFEGMLLEAYELLNPDCIASQALRERIVERSHALRERIAEALPKVRCEHDFEARAADGGAISMSQPTISICAKCGEQEDE